MTKTEALRQRKELLNLIDQWTAAEVLARLSRIGHLKCADFFELKLKKEDEIRQLLYGESELVKLGEMFGILKSSRGKTLKPKKRGGRLTPVYFNEE